MIILRLSKSHNAMANSQALCCLTLRYLSDVTYRHKWKSHVNKLISKGLYNSMCNIAYLGQFYISWWFWITFSVLRLIRLDYVFRKGSWAMPKHWCFFNPVWPSGAIRRYRNGSTLVVVLGCCLPASSHHSLPEPLTCHQYGPVTFIWEKFNKRHFNHQSLKQSKMHLFKIEFKSPWGQWVKGIVKSHESNGWVQGCKAY